MAHCPYEKLQDLQTVLNEVRGWSGIHEPKPGIFYFKSKPFLHFHVKGDDRWGDVRSDSDWQSLAAPLPSSAKQLKDLTKRIKSHYKKLVGPNGYLGTG